MRLLGSNLLPFSVAQLPGTWNTGIEAEAYFFEGDIPADLSQYFLDHRKLIADSVAVSRIVLQPTTEGLMFHQAYSHGVKAVAGSVYDPKLGVTVHYPKNIIPRRTTASGSTLDIDAAYAIDLMTGNKKLKHHLSLALFPGFPINAVRTLSDFIGTTYGQIGTVCDLVFDGLKTFDGALSDTPDKSVQTIASINSVSTTEGATPSGTVSALTVPANLATNLAPTAIVTDILRVTGNNAARRLLPVSVGDKSTTPVTKTLGHAIVLIPDSNNGALATGNYDIRIFATKIGVKGSGELIEVESLTVSSGEFVEVLQVRTATTTAVTQGNNLDWIDPNATFALDATRLSVVPMTDYLGVPFSNSGWTVNTADGSISTGFDSAITIAPADFKIDITKAFYIEFEYRQDDISLPAEFCLLSIYTNYFDRYTLAFDRSNERGFVIWNNGQSAKVARPFDKFTGMLSKDFVKVRYEYGGNTVHSIYINEVLVDQFTLAIGACSIPNATVRGPYGAATPKAIIRNYQMVPGKKPSPVTIDSSGIYTLQNMSTGESNNVYVEKVGTEDYMLIANWTSFGTQDRSWRDLVQKGYNFVPYDEISDATRPVWPTATLNKSEKWMFTSDRFGWRTLYGDYQTANTFDSAKANIAAGEAIPVSTPLGNKNFYTGGSAWNQNTLITDPIRIWTHADNSGPCGGAGIVGSDKICPIISATWGSGGDFHADKTGTKRLYLKLDYTTFRPTAKI